MRINGFLQLLLFHWKYSTVAYHTMRQFIQHDVLLTLIAVSASRPAGFVEGCGYYGTNNVLTWGDVKFFAVRHPEIPGRILLVVFLQLRLQKGKRDAGSP
jgi:Protein of unknown function (DUF3435)